MLAWSPLEILSKLVSGLDFLLKQNSWDIWIVVVQDLAKAETM